MSQRLARELVEIIAGHPANRSRPTRGLGTAVAWQIYKRAIRRPFVLRTYGGLRCRCYPDSTEPGRLLYFNRLPDYHEMLFTRRLLRPGDRYIDVSVSRTTATGPARGHSRRRSASAAACTTTAASIASTLPASRRGTCGGSVCSP